MDTAGRDIPASVIKAAPAACDNVTLQTLPVAAQKFANQI
jgi:hypothetical protein